MRVLGEEPVGETEWLQQARSSLDPDTVFLTPDAQIRQTPFDVAFFLEGYLEQLRQLDSGTERLRFYPATKGAHTALIMCRIARLGNSGNPSAD